MTLIAVAMLALSARVPLSGFTAADGKQDSPFLFGVFRLEQWLGVGTGTLVAALVAGGLSLAAVLIVRRRGGLEVALGLTLAVTAIVSLGAFSYDRTNVRAVRADHLPADKQWIDHTGLRHVTLVQIAGSPRGRGLAQLFWNRAVDRVVLLGAGEVTDAFGADQINVARDGELVAGRDVLRRPLLVDRYAVQLGLAGAVEAARDRSSVLYRPLGTPRLRWLLSGLYVDRWLARAGRLTVWPGTAARTLRLRLSLPAGAAATTMRFRHPAGTSTARVLPGQSRTVHFAVSAGGPWVLHFGTRQDGFLSDGRPVSVQASVSLR